MPHLLLERFRSFTLKLVPAGKVDPQQNKFPTHDLCIEFVEMVANMTFVIGSVAFLPRYEENLEVFLAGCILFVIGAALYLFACVFCMVESYMHHRGWSFELIENILYAIGSWIFLVGTILYWPSAAHYAFIERFQQIQFGQFFNLFTPEFEGTVLFAIGSAIFGFAAFTNALNHRNYQGLGAKLMTASTTISMAADMLFVAGSIAFLPEMGCGRGMVRLGAWLFIIGSGMFVLASFLSVSRTLLIWREGQGNLLPPEASLVARPKH